jgi:hypothetical protein
MKDFCDARDNCADLLSIVHFLFSHANERASMLEFKMP